MAVTTAGSTVASEAVAPEARLRSSTWVLQVTALSLLLGCFLGLALRAQTSIRQARLPATRFSTLVPYYEDLKNSNENLQQEVKELRQKTTGLEAQMAAGTDMTETLKKQLGNLQMLAGQTAVEGPGLVVTVRDAPPHIRAKARALDPEQYQDRNLIIHDQDLVMIINELKAAGAEALAISGADKTRAQRIIMNSAPRCSGPSIRVNDALIAQPFTIWAIGNAVELEAAMRMPGGLVETLQLEALEMIDIQRRDHIRIPAYSSSTNKYTYAKPTVNSNAPDVK